MANLYWLNQIQPHHRMSVGNKAFYLSQLLQKNFPVVPGFVVSGPTLRQFLETIEWLEPLFADLSQSSLRLDIENPRQLRAIAQQIRRSIEASPLPDTWLQELDAALSQLQAPVVVLRPSLAVTGRRTTAPTDTVAIGKTSALFDVQVCLATATDLAIGLKRLWAQLFSARSLFYWQRSGIHLQQVKLAVLVQPLQSAIASGTVESRGEDLLIQATTGLGMALAWGEVVPDIYQVQLASGVVQAQQLGTKTIAYQVRDRTAIQIPLDQAAAADGGGEMPPNSPVMQALSATAQPSSKPATVALPLLSLSPQISLASVQTLLQVHLQDSAQQAHYALDAPSLDALICLVQRLVGELETITTIEWTLVATGNSPPQFYLTQVIPGGRLPGFVGDGSFVRRPSTQRLPPARTSQVSRSDPGETVDSDRSLLVTGVAAAHGQAAARAKVIERHHEFTETIAPGTVLVAERIAPHWLPLLKQVVGIVTEQGSMMSHSAIIAREVGIPAVMAAAQATQRIQTGDLIMVDGSQGRVYRIAATEDESAIVPAPDPAAIAPTHFEPTPTVTRLMVNLSQPEGLARLSNWPIDGIGLLRAELLIPTLGYVHPGEWLRHGRQADLTTRLAQQLGQFAAALAPRPVFYRSLDLHTHGSNGAELSPLLLEANPVLGLHGTFSYCLDPTLFDLELAALAQVQQAGYRNVHLILPFVRTVEEFQFCRQRVEAIGLFRNPHFQLWIMAEVPSVLFLLPAFVAAGVQGVAIGTNDLTQLILGVDRDHGAMATAFDERHPAVKAAIAQLIQQAKQANIPCSICGQAPSRYPELVEALVEWGITAISVEPNALEATHRVIVATERRLKATAP